MWMHWRSVAAAMAVRTTEGPLVRGLARAAVSTGAAIHLYTPASAIRADGMGGECKQARWIAERVLIAMQAQRRKPPSTGSVQPVMKSFSTMKTAVAAISTGSPKRLSGTGAVTRASVSGVILMRMSVAE
jgi:glycine/D-amino acid oxidase-like deaminating enzyme